MRNEIIRLYDANNVKVFEGCLTKKEIKEICSKYNYTAIKSGSYLRTV